MVGIQKVCQIRLLLNWRLVERLGAVMNIGWFLVSCLLCPWRGYLSVCTASDYIQLPLDFL